MSDTIELERRFLLKSLPEGLDGCASKEILDIYIPRSARHPTLRLRKDGEKFMITKKEPVSGKDSSNQLEQTIELREAEFSELSAAQGKRLRKTRYYYPYGNTTAEISVFKDDMEGLVMADFEFGSPEEKESFQVPDFCLAEVTTEEAFAAGMLCGKSYEDISNKLKGFQYSRL